MAGDVFERGKQAWVDAMVRQITDEVTATDLPGKGQPIPDIDEPYKTDWWIRKKLRRENISVETPALKLRREIEKRLATATQRTCEQTCRSELEAINVLIREGNRSITSGPPLNLAVIDVETAMENRTKALARNASSQSGD